MVRVKICGITNLEDAGAALDFGADALGFVFAESPRQVSQTTAKKIITKLGPWICAVGVFVNEKPGSILKIASECGLSAIQLHGNETSTDSRRLSAYKIIKTFHVDEALDWKRLDGYPADAYLLDTKVKGRLGGTGKTFQWDLLKNRTLRKPFILSGGLHPKNVREAIQRLSPYGVDVSSGVEKAPGKKDRKLMKEFIQNAKAS